MTLQFRRLRLRAETSAGSFGTDIEFTTGLNVLWAENTKGKSTCLQGLLYALGLERMLSPRRETPLTYVMTSHLDDPETGERHSVLESSVWVEMQNGVGEIITVRRGVVTSGNKKLVSVFTGPMLSEPSGDYSQRDFFVLDPGAAHREAGFHRMLADFIGWKLPTVRRFDGGEGLLYLETIFPLVYVEQKAGWSSIPAAFPSWLQIRSVAQRAVEFILGLETHDLELRRQSIEIDLVANSALWVAKRDELMALARSINARIEGLPVQPTLSVADLERVVLRIGMGDEWRELTNAVAVLRAQLAELSQEEVPAVESIAPELERQVVDLTASLTQQNARRVELFRSRQVEAGQILSVSRRIQALDEDLKKNLDVQKLKNLGSSISETLTPTHCPTCDQPIADTLLAQVPAQVMPVEDNIEYIRAQRGIFLRLKSQAEYALTQIEYATASNSAALVANSSRLRAVRADLVSPSNAPSIAALQERLRLETRILALEGVNDEFERRKQSLIEIAQRHAALLGDKARLPESRFTATDLKKLASLTASLKSQAIEYGFSTFPAAEIDISEDTYRPQKRGFEIGFELSASDAIRLKWAYQMALMEVARVEQTNHPGFVVFDEPRQQETAEMSFFQLLRRASLSTTAGQQVIFATSEDRDQLQEYLEDLDCNLVPFEGPIVRRL